MSYCGIHHCNADDCRGELHAAPTDELHPAGTRAELSRLRERAEKAEADAAAMRGALGEDASGRPFGELLRIAGRMLREYGGGPAADCLLQKAEDVEAALSADSGAALLTRLSEAEGFRDLAEAKVGSLLAELKKLKRHGAEDAREIEQKADTIRDLEKRLGIVRTKTEDVWFWQGDGHDHPESLTCPVVMEATTLRSLLAEVERLRAEAKSNGGAEDWMDGHCPNGCGASLMRWWKWCPACGNRIDESRLAR